MTNTIDECVALHVQNAMRIFVEDPMANFEKVRRDINSLSYKDVSQFPTWWVPYILDMVVYLKFIPPYYHRSFCDDVLEGYVEEFEYLGKLEEAEEIRKTFFNDEHFCRWVIERLAYEAVLDCETLRDVYDLYTYTE